MYKLFKKFGSLALVICTVVALAALPASAQEYWVTYIPDSQLADTNGNTFTPGLSIKGEDEEFEYVKTSGTIRTFTHTLSLQNVYALSKFVVNYDNAAHSSDTKVFYEKVGIMDTNETYFLNRKQIRLFNGTTFANPQDITVEIENTDSQDLFAASAHIMLSNNTFTVTNNGLCRFPSRLGTFEWTKIVTLAEILAS